MKPNKPIGRINSGLRSIYLVLRIVLTCFVLYMALSRCSLLASAEDVILTPQQTAALLGSSFPVTYHNSQTNIELNMTASLIGTTNDFGLYYPGGGWGSAMPFHYVNNNHRDAISPYNYAPGLVYAVPFANVDDFVTSNSAAFFNFRNDFSISLTGITRFEMPIFWGASRSPNWGERSVFNVNTNSGLSSGVAVHSNSTGHPYYQAYIFKTEDLNEDFSAADADRIFLNCFPLNLQSADEFNVSGITCGYNACNTYDLVDNPDPRVGFFYIIIECPVISNFTPATTPPPSVTTRSPYTGQYFVTTPLYTYDLSPLETNQLNQIRIQNEQLQYEAGVFDGINIIIQQLNDIYNRMVESGEIAVDLVGGFDWSVNTDIQNYVNNAVTSFTMAQISPASYFDTPNNIYDLLGGYNWLKPFAVVGGFSTAFGIFCWFVFRGRKGG